MSEFQDIKELPMEKLVFGKGQVRVDQVGADVDELAASIKKIGLLLPITVCPSDKEGHYEVLTGQRRFLAHKKLGRDKILACIREKPSNEAEAKIISLTENMVRKDLSRKDLISVCTDLYRQYGSVNDVCRESGLPRAKVQLYVKFDRLKPELQKLVKDGEVDMKVALKAQDVAEVTGEYKKEDAMKLAKEMQEMTGPMRKKVEKLREQSPDQSADDIIDAAKTGEQEVQMMVTLGSRASAALALFANEEGSSKDDSASQLIEEGLSEKGYMESERE